MAEPVIGGALLVVLQDVIGLADVLELLLGGFVSGIAVRVKLHRELAVGSLQPIGIGRFRHAKDVVKVLLRHCRGTPGSKSVGREPPSGRSPEAASEKAAALTRSRASSRPAPRPRFGR